MKKYIRKVLITIIFIILNLETTVYANNREIINFENLTIEDGLSQALVSYIYQDSDGYIWLATDSGLNKYNGNEIEIFKNDRDNKNTLSNSMISAIIEDNNRNLWVGTRAGVNKMNLDTKKITRYLNSPEDIMDSNTVVDEIFIDSKNRIWVCTKNTLNLYDEQKDEFIKIGSELLLNKELQDITEDYKGNIWIAAKMGLYIYYPEENIIKEVNSENLWVENTLDKNVFSLESFGNKIYIGTQNQGLKIIDLQKETIKSYKDTNKDNSIPSNLVRDILYDKDNRIWVATDRGLALFDDKSETFTTYTKSESKYSICDDNTINLYEDRSGVIWVGTFNGVSRFTKNDVFTIYRNGSNNPNSLSNNSVCGIYEDDDGLIWVGTFNSGVNVINRETGTVTRIFSEEDGGYLSSNRIKSIVGEGNEIYIATENGLNKIDKKNQKITMYNSTYDQEYIKNREVRSLFIDNNKNIWVGTNGGLYSFDGKEKYIDYNPIFEANDIYEKTINAIYEDSKGNIWVGMGNQGGLVKYNPETKEIINYKEDSNKEGTLSDNTVRSITEDLNGNIWVGTQDGLNKYNTESNRFEVFLQNKGLSNDFIYGVIVDDNNNLWASTNYGISRYDQEKEYFTRYYEADGLASNEHNGFSYCKGKDGRIYFGGVNGLTEINSNKIIENNTVKTSVKIDKIKTNNGVQLKETNNFVLDYDSRSLYIEFFVPEYMSGNKIHYFYKLEGVDEEWIFAENEYYARYANLSPGKYIMKVVARNYNGNFTDITEVNFKLKTSPFKSPLAISIYIIIIGVILFLYYNNLKLLESLVDKRTLELNNKLVENKMLYKKLIKIERYKNNYFVNLSHELRTPLNVILSIEQLIRALTKDGKKLEDEKLQTYMKTLKNNSNRLLNLINNIIDTSKIESGSYRIDLSEVNIVSVVEDTALSMTELAEIKGVDLIVDPDIEEYILKCDKMEIERCITNLVGNAIKFTNSGGEIVVGIIEERDYIKISVKDTGIGIDPKYRESIFDRFGQIYSNTTEELGGSGLGLTLTKNLIQLHNGTIDLISEKGVGSEFIIRLPKNNLKSTNEK